MKRSRWQFAPTLTNPVVNYVLYDTHIICKYIPGLIFFFFYFLPDFEFGLTT